MHRNTHSVRLVGSSILLWDSSVSGLCQKISQDLNVTTSLTDGRVARLMSRPIRRPERSRANPSCCLRRKWSPDGTCGTETPLICLRCDGGLHLIAGGPPRLDDVRRDEEAQTSWLVPVLHMFYLSKVLDFFDPLFMIVKGNWRQVSLLHVYYTSLWCSSASSIL